MRSCILPFIAALLPLTTSAQSAFTDAREHRPTDDFAIRACSDAAEREARSRSPGASQVAVDHAEASPTADTRTDVSGKGSLRDGSGASRGFTFRCTYDLRTGAATGVTVSL